MKKSFPQWKHVCSAISLLRHAFVVWQPTGVEAALARLRGNGRPGQKHCLEKAAQQGEENPTLTWQLKPPDDAYLLVSSLYRLCLPIHARTVCGPNIEVGKVGGEDHLLETTQPRDGPSYIGGRERNKHRGGGTAVPCSAWELGIRLPHPPPTPPHFFLPFSPPINSRYMGMQQCWYARYKVWRAPKPSQVYFSLQYAASLMGHVTKVFLREKIILIILIAHSQKAKDLKGKWTRKRKESGWEKIGCGVKRFCTEVSKAFQYAQSPCSPKAPEQSPWWSDGKPAGKEVLKERTKLHGRITQVFLPESKENHANFIPCVSPVQGLWLLRWQL